MDATHGLEALSWLTGDWRGEGNHETLEEHYSSAVGGTILGTSREIADASPHHREFLLFEQQGSDVTLTVIIPSQTVLIFRLSRAETGVHVFETADTPAQQLVFRQTSATRMCIELDTGRSPRQEFVLHRIAALAM